MVDRSSIIYQLTFISFGVAVTKQSSQCDVMQELDIIAGMNLISLIKLCNRPVFSGLATRLHSQQGLKLKWRKLSPPHIADKPPPFSQSGILIRPPRRESCLPNLPRMERPPPPSPRGMRNFFARTHFWLALSIHATSQFIRDEVF